MINAQSASQSRSSIPIATAMLFRCYYVDGQRLGGDSHGPDPSGKLGGVPSHLPQRPMRGKDSSPSKCSGLWLVWLGWKEPPRSAMEARRWESLGNSQPYLCNLHQLYILISLRSHTITVNTKGLYEGQYMAPPDRRSYETLQASDHASDSGDVVAREDATRSWTLFQTRNLQTSPRTSGL